MPVVIALLDGKSRKYLEYATHMVQMGVGNNNFIQTIDSPRFKKVGDYRSAKRIAAIDQGCLPSRLQENGLAFADIEEGNLKGICFQGDRGSEPNGDDPKSIFPIHIPRIAATVLKATSLGSPTRFGRYH